MQRPALLAVAVLALSGSVALAHAAPAPSPASAGVQADAPAQIRAEIARMQEAWNRGDFRGYMDGFWNPGVVFVSKGRILTGWQETLDHYIRDYDTPDKRGRVQFSQLQVQMLGPDVAQLISHYRLDRPGDPQDGINTRLFRRINGRWVIALNHVSSKEPPATPSADAPAAIRAVLDRQVAAWNTGDFDGFMTGYWNSPDLKFVSGSKVTTGWAQTLAHYKAAYATPDKRGRLTFTNPDVQMLGPDSAVVLGRWRIDGPKPAEGAFTLTFRKLAGDWVIVLDHTS